MLPKNVRFAGIRSMAIGFILCLVGSAFVSLVRGEILTVPATSSNGVSSSILDAGTYYLLEATGTYVWGAGQADAEWAVSGVSGAPLEVYPGFTYATDTLDLLIDGVAWDWMGTTDGITWATHTYSPSHVYRLEVLGVGDPLAFSIADQSPFGPEFYSNNSGSLAVSITVIPEPASIVPLFFIGMVIWVVGRKRG